jgi:hypothetical protein
MKYCYEDLSVQQFETLIVLLCQHLLGISVQGFTAGPDGGRDAKFIGTAELHPSKAAPWAGITIIQAKHTNGYNRHFSESDFYSRDSENTIVGTEIPKIKSMREHNQLDHYMLFANRRLTGIAETEIRNHIATQCSLTEESVYLCGVEQLEILLKHFPDIPKLAALDLVDSPLIVSPDDLAEVVQALARQRNTIAAVLDAPPTPRISYEEKNKINNMTIEYSNALRRRYLKETTLIHTFLAAPENAELQRMYESVVDEFQMKIISKRRDYQTFDEVMEYLINLLFNRDPVLSQYKRLTRAVLFYMYWNCDIGKVNNVETE